MEKLIFEEKWYKVMKALVARNCLYYEYLGVNGVYSALFSLDWHFVNNSFQQLLAL